MDNTGTSTSTSGQHLSRDAIDKLCLAWASVDAARQQLCLYANATDLPLWIVVDAADMLDEVADFLSGAVTGGVCDVPA